ncbi:MAG: VOC family protein [Proteobacteria bacterium]|nr:VOC family protein [Pseudomonadota bacterium]
MKTKFLRVSPRLPVTDLNRAIAFYTTILGFEAGDPWPEEAPSFVLLQKGPVSIQFYVPNASKPEPAGYGTLSIDVEDAMAVHAAVKDRVKIDWGPETYWYGRREFSFRDPEGYALIISEETDATPDCEK